MKAVKIADLKNNLSRHLARVREGGELTVLDRDTPIARIVPFVPRVAVPGKPAEGRGAAAEEAQAHVAELERLGVVGPGAPGGLAAWVKAHQAVRLPKGTPSAVDLLLQMRRESTR